MNMNTNGNCSLYVYNKYNFSTNDSAKKQKASRWKEKLQKLPK